MCYYFFAICEISESCESCFKLLLLLLYKVYFFSALCHSKPVSFFLMLNIKEDILKNASNQTVDGSHWLPQYIFSN